MESNPQFFNPYSQSSSTPAWDTNPGPSNSANFPNYGIPGHGGHPSSLSPSPPTAAFAPNMNSPFYGAGSDFIKSGLGAYGEKLLGNSRDYVQSNMNRFFSFQALKYYFQVNENYVKSKLKIILFPFLHRGHWTRIAEQVSGVLLYQPPSQDVNAPDLYVPVMSFFTYVLLSAISIGLNKKFTPDALHVHASRGMLGWGLHVLLLRFLLYALHNSATPLLDLVAYAGYAFVGVSVSMLSHLALHRSLYYVVVLWTSLSMGYFLQKTMKRVLFVESRNFGQDSSRHRYALILLVLAQVPIFFWLGNV